MSERAKLRKQRYIVAGIITLIIFLLGFSLGLVFENKRVDYVNNVYEDNTLELTSSQVQYDYIKRLVNEEDCQVVFDIYHSSLEELDETTKRVESYAINEKINTGEFDRLKRKYVLSQLKYYMLGDDIHKTCPNLDIATVLYFYGTQADCPDCESQSFVLDYVKRKFKQASLIFAFNAEDTNERGVDLLISSFRISELPAVVVNGKVYQGLTETQTIIDDLCEGFGNDTKVEACLS